MSRPHRQPELSDRDRTVLGFVADCSLVTAAQLEALAFPAVEGSAQSAARRARRALARLVDHGLLARLDRRVGGVRAGSAGYVYQLTTAGRRSLGRSGRGRTWEPGGRFIDHTLAAAQVHVDLIDAQRHGHLGELHVAHEPATLRRFSTPAGVQRLCPDLLVEVTTNDGWELRWFVEIDRGTEHLPTVVRKCRVYESYWRSGQEATRHEVFPRVLWSVADDTRAERIRVAISATRGLPDELFSVATADATAAVITNPNDTLKGGHP